MSEFTIRSESVDVEQIMKQIRSRVLEKRGTDYTEDEVRELATVRLEKFLDAKNLRSDLLEQFRKSRPAVVTEPASIDPPYVFDDQTLFISHRGPLRFMRKLLRPLLKLFFNPNTLNQILHSQAQFNVDLLKREARRKIEFDRSRAEWNALYYEVLHNLVLETTRLGIERLERVEPGGGARAGADADFEPDQIGRASPPGVERLHAREEFTRRRGHCVRMVGVR